MPAPLDEQPTLLLLTTDQTYRERAFVAAAERLGLQALVAVDAPPALVCGTRRRGVPFDEPGAAATLTAWAAPHQPRAVLAVDDSGTLLAAAVAAALALPHNDAEAAEAARDKFVMRTLLARAAVPVPSFRRCSTADDLDALAAESPYPCVLKPLRLNGSRGVMRADTPQEFVVAARRLGRLLEQIYGAGPHPFLVEGFIPGFEVAIEGLLDGGVLRPLALFDKPDPLDGPFFEETIYVTPSRLPEAVQASIVDCVARAALALGLREGPIHGEVRVHEQGPWVVEVAARSIGGQCSQTLRFGTDASLEELILRQACGLPLGGLGRVGGAGGVMMIPIPAAGLLKSVSGIEAARAVPGITGIEISAALNYPLVPLPEGESYLGFIFAEAASPAAAEAALRAAHGCLRFDVQPLIALS